MIPWIDAAAVPVQTAVDALEHALLEGLDPEADPARGVVKMPAGQLLLMPSQHGEYAGVKLASVAPANPSRGLPRIQGVYTLFDADTLTPVALMDGAALTSLRTPAMSAVAVRHLARPGARRLVVFGRGPQARAHAEVLSLEHVELVGRGDKHTRLVREADVICCCTSAREPIFEGDLVRDGALVIAIGSHEPDARELDEGLMRRAAVVVESRAGAMREAGDVIQAGLDPDALITIDAVVRGEARVPDGRPRVFKGVGMAWQDVVVAAAAWESDKFTRKLRVRR